MIQYVQRQKFWEHNNISETEVNSMKKILENFSSNKEVRE